MFLEKPVYAAVLREQVACRLDQAATPSRYTSSQDSSNLAQRTVVSHRAASSHNARRHFGERHVRPPHLSAVPGTTGISGAVADSVDETFDGNQ